MKYLLVLILLLSCQSKVFNDNSTIEISNEKPSVKIKLIEFEQIQESDTEVLAIHLVPSLYNSFFYFEILKRLDQNEISPHIISSSGFSAVIAALYANSKSMNEFEWSIFKLYHLIEKEKPFTYAWAKFIEDFLKKEFGNKRLYQLNRLLLISKNKKNKIFYDNESKVVDSIMNSITSRKRTSFYIAPKLDLVELKKQSYCDYCIFIAANPKTVNLNSPQKEYFSFFTKISGKIESTQNIINLEKIETKMDKLYGLEVLYNKYNGFLDEKVNEIKNKINKG